MKIAVTSQNRKAITGHAGKCRKFWIYEADGKKIVNKTLLELELDQSLHASHGAGPHPLDGIDVLISGGAGQGLIRRLDSMGIQGLVTTETEPDSAVAAFLDGTLKLGQAGSHEGHGEHHGGEHGCCH
jgi:predicted Fe-Mo cluster-binding NifX family protein